MCIRDRIQLDHTLPLESGEVGDELVCDEAQRDLGDVELVLRDQAEQQVERTVKCLHRDAKRLLVALGIAGRCRGSSSRLDLGRLLLSHRGQDTT